MNSKILMIFFIFFLIFGCVEEPMHQEENGLDYQDVLDGQDYLDDSNGLDYQDGLDDFPDFDEDFFDLEKPSEYKIVYEFTTGYDGETIKQIHAYYFKENKTRIDSTFGEVTQMMFFLNEDVFKCSDAENKLVCMAWFSIETPESYMFDFKIDEKELKSKYYNNQVIFLPDEVIGGKNAKCVSLLTLDLETTEIKYCFAEGIIVYVESESLYGLHKLKAKEISLTVPDSDFELPVEPITLDDL